MLKVKTRLDS